MSSQTTDQAATFKRAAKELACDESEARFDAALRTIAKPKPPDKPKTAKPETTKPGQ